MKLKIGIPTLIALILIIAGFRVNVGLGNHDGETPLTVPAPGIKATPTATAQQQSDRVEFGFDSIQYSRFSQGVVKELKWVRGNDGILNLQAAVVTITDVNRTIDRAVFLTDPVKVGEKVTIGWYKYGTVAGAHDVPFIVRPDGKG